MLRLKKVGLTAYTSQTKTVAFTFALAVLALAVFALSFLTLFPWHVVIHGDLFVKQQQQFICPSLV